MNLSLETLCGGKDAVLSRLLSRPAVVNQPGNADLALKEAAASVRETVVTGLSAELSEKLVEAVDLYQMVNGERANDGTMTLEQLSEWDSGLDDVVSDLLEPYSSHLSANWLGNNTVDTRAHEETEREKLADSFGEEVFSALAQKRSPGQLLSAVGVVRADIEAYLDAYRSQNGVPAAQEPGTLTETQARAFTSLARRLGPDFDVMGAYDELDLMSDADDTLRVGAFQRVFGAGDDGRHDVCEALRSFRLANPGSPVDAMIEVIQRVHRGEALLSAAPPPAVVHAVQDAPLPQAGRGKKAAQAAPPATAGGSLDGKVLSLIKAHSSVTDRDLSEGLGVSRATANNLAAGKSPFNPTPAQRDYLEALVKTHLNGLLEALFMIDGELRDPYE